jgi:glycosyltransferase involved in cell wall biosynthesis
VFSKFQQAGIKNAELLIMEKQSKETEAKVQRLRGPAGRRSYNAIPMLHQPTYENLDTGSAEVTSEFHDSVLRLRTEFDFLLFHHSRHSWLDPPSGIEQKGNNLLFEGLRDFLLANPSVSAAVVTLDYGVDVQNSKDLILELGLKENVFWFSKQKRIDLMMGISVCDVVVAELTGGYNLYGTVMEALCQGKPIIQSREKDKYENVYEGGLHNALCVENYNSVGDLLNDYWFNRSFYNESAEKGPKWYDDNIVAPFMKEITRIIKSKGE